MYRVMIVCTIMQYILLRLCSFADTERVVQMKYEITYEIKPNHDFNERVIVG